MSDASSSTLSTSQPTACRQQRWRRSTWHRLLEALEACIAPRQVSLATLLARPAERVRAWRDAVEEMPLADQWRLAVLAEVLLPHESEVKRYTQTLRGQLEARSAYRERGTVRTNATPDEARAMGEHAELTHAAISRSMPHPDVRAADRIVTDARHLFESSTSVLPTIPKAG